MVLNIRDTKIILRLATNGQTYKNSNILATPGTFSNGDVLGWAYDADNNVLKLYKNGSLVHTENSIEI